VSKDIVELTNDNFDKEVIQAEMPVLVDFWAPWCPPCKALTPALAEIAAGSEERFKVAKVNVDVCPEIASRWNVMNIPTMILLKDGKEAARLVGLMSKQKILERINNIL